MTYQEHTGVRFFAPTTELVIPDLTLMAAMATPQNVGWLTGDWLNNRLDSLVEHPLMPGMNDLTALMYNPDVLGSLGVQCLAQAFQDAPELPGGGALAGLYDPQGGTDWTGTGLSLPIEVSTLMLFGPEVHAEYAFLGAVTTDIDPSQAIYPAIQHL